MLLMENGVNPEFMLVDQITWGVVIHRGNVAIGSARYSKSLKAVKLEHIK